MMRNLFLLVFIFVLLEFNSCSNKVVTGFKETILINGIFLDLIDTSTYEYRSLLPYGEKQLVNKNDSFFIAVSDQMKSFKKWDGQIQSVLIEIDDQVYKEILNQKTDGKENIQIDLSKIKNLGRFKLVAGYDFKRRESSGVIGSIEFSRIKFNLANTKALFVIKIKDNVKSDEISLILVEKRNEKWKIFKKIVLEVS